MVSGFESFSNDVEYACKLIFAGREMRRPYECRGVRKSVLEMLVFGRDENDGIAHSAMSAALPNMSVGARQDRFDVTQGSFRAVVRIVPDDKRGSAELMYDYAPIGNAICALAASLDTKFNERGIHCKFTDNKTGYSTFECVFDGKDDILRFVGLDPVRYAMGFDGAEEIRDFIMKSDLAVGRVFLKNMAATKLRGIRRATIDQYQHIARAVAMLKTAPPPPRKTGADGIDEFFGDGRAEKARQGTTEIRLRYKAIKGKCNAQILMDEFGVSRDTAEHMIGCFRKHVIDGLVLMGVDGSAGEIFDSYVYVTPRHDILRDMRKYFDGLNKK